MMQTTAQKTLQRIKGIGTVLAQRLVESGIDTPAKLAELGEEGLRQLRGINRRAVPAILAQAQTLAEGPPENSEQANELLRQSSLRLQAEVQRLVAAALENHGDKLAGKKGERLEKQMRKLLAGLERVNGALGAGSTRAAKGLSKVEKRLDALTGDSVKALTQGLKKARKPLKRFRA